MESYSEYAYIFKALSDETRLEIVEILTCGELCASDILESFPITQSTLSYHMKILTKSGLVIYRKEGACMRYHNNKKMITTMKELWDMITTERADCICKPSKKCNTCDIKKEEYRKYIE